MKKALLLISMIAIFVLLTACNPFAPDPGPGPSPTPSYKIDGTYTLTNPNGTLELEDMSTTYPDVIVSIPSQAWNFDSGSYNMVFCNINNNSFEFHATKTYTAQQQTIDLTNFTVGENSISGTISYNGNAIQVSGTRQ